MFMCYSLVKKRFGDEILQIHNKTLPKNILAKVILLDTLPFYSFTSFDQCVEAINENNLRAVVCWWFVYHKAYKTLRELLQRKSAKVHYIHISHYTKEEEPNTIYEKSASIITLLFSAMSDIPLNIFASHKQRLCLAGDSTTGYYTYMTHPSKHEYWKATIDTQEGVYTINSRGFLKHEKNGKQITRIIGSYEEKKKAINSFLDDIEDTLREGSEAEANLLMGLTSVLVYNAILQSVNKSEKKIIIAKHQTDGKQA